MSWYEFNVSAMTIQIKSNRFLMKNSLEYFQSNYIIFNLLKINPRYFCKKYISLRSLFLLQVTRISRKSVEPILSKSECRFTDAARQNAHCDMLAATQLAELKLTTFSPTIITNFIVSWIYSLLKTDILIYFFRNRYLIANYTVYK